jgi:hypothetical protein
VAEAITELVEVRVDVARTPGSQGDQAELGIDAAQQALVIIVSWLWAMCQSLRGVDGLQPGQPSGKTAVPGGST